MIFGALWLALASPGSTPQAAAGGGFPCTDALSPPEALICGDAELSAYDRAMSFAYAHRWRPHGLAQKQWAAQRDQCMGQRACVRSTYADWIAQLEVRDAVGRAFDRIGASARGGADLVRRPRPFTRPGEYATLIVQPLGADWYLFAVTAQYFFDPHDGIGMDRHVSERAGLVHLRGGKGRYIDDPEAADACAIDFARSSARVWKVTEIGSCGGQYAHMSGSYVR